MSAQPPDADSIHWRRLAWQPTLAGARVAVRPARESDREATFEAANDPLIWEQHSDRDRYTRPVFDRFFDGALACGGGLAILEHATGQVVGSTRFYDWDASVRSVVIGYTFIVRRLWGTGFNRELKDLLLDHAFRWADSAWFHVSPGNIRSQRALGKLGARLDREELVLVAGVMSPRLLYRVERADWLSRVRGAVGVEDQS